MVSLVAGSAQEECDFGVIAAHIQHMDIGRSECVHFGRVVVLPWFIGLVYGFGDPTFAELLSCRIGKPFPIDSTVMNDGDLFGGPVIRQVVSAYESVHVVPADDPEDVGPPEFG